MSEEVNEPTLKLDSPRIRAQNQSFRDLHVWQRSMELAGAVYRIAQVLPREEIFGLGSQLRRSAVSIPSNIAEGHGRMNSRELRRFLFIARGSNSELQTQLEIASDMGFVAPQLVKTAVELSRQVDNMLLALLRNVKNNSG